MSDLPDIRPCAENDPAAPRSAGVESPPGSPSSLPGIADAAGPSGLRQWEIEEAERFHVKPLIAAHVSDDSQPWPAPVDFWKEAKVPEMRHEWMPPALADLCYGEAETWGSDPGMFGLFGIGICGGALSKAITVQVKEGDSNALKACRLWLCVSGYSGSGKSPALVAMSRPLEHLQERLMDQVAHAVKKYLMDKDIYEAQRRSYVTAKAKGDPANEPTEPFSPTRNRLIVKNITIEAVPEILKDQGKRGILGLYDEMTSFPTGAGQYKPGGNDIEEMLRLRDGGPHIVDRKGVYTRVEENSMNIVGGTQPDRIRQVCKKMSLTNNGFLQRFNFYQAREATLDLDRPAHADFERMADIVERIHGLQHVGPVQFSPGAQSIRRDFRQWCFDQRQIPWISDTFKSHLSKFGDMFAEFCLVYHAIESADERCMTIKPAINQATAKRVQALMTQCLFKHAQGFYGDVLEADGDTIKHVRYLAGKILAKGWTSIDLTKIAQGWTKWRTFKPWEKRAILTMLSEGGWIQPNDARGYIEGIAFKARVHPELITIFEEYVGMEQARLEEMAERRLERMAGED